MDFSEQIRQWANRRRISMNKAIAMTAIRLGTNIIERTPIDTGRAKGNWMSAYGSADTSTSETRMQNEALQGLHAKFTVAEVGRNSSIFITNSLPYINHLEYGLYPNPSKGSKTENGFSKQAPAGMVRVSVAEFKRILEREVNNAQ